MKIAAAFFVLSASTAFILWYLNILPTIGVTYVLLGGLAAWIGIADHDFSRKVDEAVEQSGYTIPEGWGSVLPDVSGKTRERAMSYHGSETRKTIALMKDIDAELEERNDPYRSNAIRWGYTVKEVNEALTSMASAKISTEEPRIIEDFREKINARPRATGKSDEIYDLPSATYPMEMEQEL